MNIEKLDIGIKDLVVSLNEIPFVETIESCSGHLEDELKVLYEGKNYLVKAHPRMKFMRLGALLFNVNEKHEKCNYFLYEVEKLSNKYKFVKYFENKGHQCFFLEHYDLTDYQLVNNNDSVITYVKKCHQVDKEDGIKRINEFNLIWQDFLEIANKYVNL